MNLDFLTIPQPLRQVKFKSRFLMALLCAGLALGCQTEPKYQIRTDELYSEARESHPNYLVMPLRYEAAAEMRKKLEAHEHMQLKNRGEAHITVITPPEYEMLKSHLTMAEIEQIAQKQGLQKAPLKVICIGKGQTSPQLATYFLVVKSQALTEIRSEIEKTWRARGGAGAFSASHFYPHITLGFTERDLHEADGVIKDERSCLSDVSAR